MYSVSYTQRSQYKCNITEKEVYLGFRGYSPAHKIPPQGARGQQTGDKRAKGLQTGENLTGPSGTESIMGLHRG